MIFASRIEKVVERLIVAYDVIRFNLNNDIAWFDETCPQMQNCFWFLIKRAISTRDNLRLFGSLWPTIDRNMKKPEYIQRVTILVWSDFVFSLSSVEFFLKNIIKASLNGPLVEWLQEKREAVEKEEKSFWMYLTNIMEESRKRKLIKKPELRSWRGMIQLRNVIIHNNGMFEKDETLNIGEIEISAYAGKTIDTMLINYPKFITTLIALTRGWIESYLKVHELEKEEKQA